LEDLLELPHLLHMKEILSSKEVLQVCEERLDTSRPALLEFLREIGLRRVSQRQQIANAFSRTLRAARRAAEASAAEAAALEAAQDIIAADAPAPPAPEQRHSIQPAAIGQDPESLVRASNRHLWLTPCNWHVCTDERGAGPSDCQMAVSACPGAYLRLRWEGGQSGCDAVVIEVDTSAATMDFMSLSFSFDGGEPLSVQLPPGRTAACVELASEVPFGPGPHELWLSILNSRQSLDRWGGNGHLPDSSFRLRAVHLPSGARTLPPRPRSRRALFFGDSVTEGVGARYGPGSTGDLHSNDAVSTWATRVASALDAEYSIVAYGKIGWTLAGNGGVPPFFSSLDERLASWSFLWSGVPRVYDAGEEGLDFVFVNLGTNDGLIGGGGALRPVRRAVEEWLGLLRLAVGPDVKVFVVVPFGGFGARTPPRSAITSAFELYQQSAQDRNAFLLDLGEDAMAGLTGFRFGANGKYEPTAESCDGIHPTTQRHGELGDLAATAARRLLARDSNHARIRVSQTLKSLDNALRVRAAEQVAEAEAAVAGAETAAVGVESEEDEISLV